MKLSKFVKRAKSESYCVVIHADDSGIWLAPVWRCTTPRSCPTWRARNRQARCWTLTARRGRRCSSTKNTPNTPGRTLA